MESSLIYLLNRTQLLYLWLRLRVTARTKKQAENTQPLQYDAAPIVMTIVVRI